MTWYIYFVSYSAGQGFGRAEVRLANEVKSIVDVDQLEAELRAVCYPGLHLIVLWYQLLRTEDEI